MNTIPKNLYKYRSYNEITLKMLQNNEVYFASPLDFNDPFDCAVQKQVHDNFRDEITRFFVAKNLRIPMASVTREQIHNLRAQVRADQNPSIIENDHVIETTMMEFSNQIGILSLSACNDSILMWSHYADFHKGFCIGFGNYLDLPNDHRNHIREVLYSESLNTRPLFDLFFRDGDLKEFEEEFWRLYVLTKYIDWAYEKEWRIIGLVRRIVTYPDKSIDRIIFGLRMPKEQRSVIRSILQGKDVKYFEAIEGIDFAISIREIVD
jgi:hypothetical protein